MFNLFFLDYNTYGNRIVKKESSLSNYLSYEVARETSANFNVNDGVDTVAVVNSSTTGNYLVVADSESNIVSRWFVMENIYKRNGQHFVKLKRDLMVDYWEGVKSSPCFIEKATVSEYDSAIFNRENMTFNQIKTSETPLKDETGCAWVVGYIPRDSFNTPQNVDGSVILDHTADYEYSTLQDFPLADLVGQTYNGPAYNIVFETHAKYSNQSGRGRIISNYFNTNNIVSVSDNTALNSSLILGTYTQSVGMSLIEIDVNPNDIYKNSFITTMRGLGESYFRPYTNYSGSDQSIPDIEDIMEYDNKVIKLTNNGLYYRVRFTKISSNTNKNYISEVSELGTTWLSNLNTGILTSNGKTPNNKSFRLSYGYDVYQLTLEQVFTTATVTLDNTRYHLEDQPYDMFCIPYSDELEIYKNGTKILTANKSIALNMSVEIARDSGDTAIYDVQLLPYCPVRYMIKSDGTFDIGDSFVHYIKDGNNNNIGVILWATTSSFTLDIPYTISVDNVKLVNECDVYRLSSPNYNGQFEFNPAKNGGVTSFNVDCTYKPFNPYIHLNPNFGRLYGRDFNDARGLICGGDFSLPQLSNAWANYELQNKNYQNIFDRQIQNMEFNNKIANINAGVGAIGNALGTGLGAGAVGLGAGLVAGIGNAIAGAVDIGLQVAQQKETIDYTKDLFGYQLGNIQAIPTNLVKTTAFTYNNKIFPILEYYTCTEEEKQALRDKIKYNGMTVMRIGKIEDYLQPEQTYIKGQLIRLQVNEDNHLLEAIRQEVNKGVYV